MLNITSDNDFVNQDVDDLLSDEELKRQKRKEYSKQWYEKNKEKRLKQCAEYQKKNKERIKEKRKIYYQQNKERILTRQKAYYKSKPKKQKPVITEEDILKRKERSKEYQREYYQKNKIRKKNNIKENYKKKSEEIKKYNRDYRKKNADKIYERTRIYRHAHRDKFSIYHKKRYEKMLEHNDNTITSEFIVALFSDTKDCPYCGKTMVDGGEKIVDMKTIDHLVPIAKGGWHSKHNVIVCCHHCNSRKTNLDYSEWVERLVEPYKTSAKKLYMEKHEVDNLVEQKHK